MTCEIPELGIVVLQFDILIPTIKSTSFFFKDSLILYTSEFWNYSFEKQSIFICTFK